MVIKRCLIGQSKKKVRLRFQSVFKFKRTKAFLLLYGGTANDNAPRHFYSLVFHHASKLKHYLLKLPSPITEPHIMYSL